MKKRYKISVTEEDIRSGRGCSGSACPITLATERVTGLQAYVNQKIRLSGYGSDLVFREQWIHLPERATEFVMEFDDLTNGYGRMLAEDARLIGALEPFEFEIEVEIGDPAPLIESCGPGLQM